MPLLWIASFGHLLKHPAQLFFALLSLAVGVASIVAVDISIGSSQRAFELSMEAANGAATHQIFGATDGIDEQLYVRLRRAGMSGVAEPPAFAPVVEGYVSVGGRDLRLLGIDPVASAELNAGLGSRDGARPVALPPDAIRMRAAGLGKWFILPGSVVMAAETARQMGIHVGDSFVVNVEGTKFRATLIAELSDQNSGFESLLLTDISQAQEWLGMRGLLSRIEVRVPSGAGEADTLKRLHAQLPPEARIETAGTRTRDSLDMTAAFSTNLQAMSLLALLVSAFLIYGAMSFTVVQRRRVFGLLRALGATRAEVLAIVLVEAAILGIVGAGLGALAGVLIGRELLSLVSRTINDLYFVVVVNEIAVPPMTIIKALLAGAGASILAAILPALEVIRSMPQLGLRRSALEERASVLARRLAIASAGLAAVAWLITSVSTRSLQAGFVSLFLLLLSAAAFTPAALKWLATRVASVAGTVSPIARLAFGDVAASLSRTGVAIAALGIAVTAMVGVAIMLQSFRESLQDWLGRTLRADIYVTAPGFRAERPPRPLDPGVVAKLLATQGIADYSMSRNILVSSSWGHIGLVAFRIASGGYSSVPLLAGESGPSVWRAFDRGAVIISEPLAWRSQLRAGDELALESAQGWRKFPIAGVYREYGNDRGTVLINLAVYRQLWHDDAVTSLSLFLKPGTRATDVITQLRAAAGGRQPLLLTSNADIRALSTSLFDRTFAITAVLDWLAAAVASIGLFNSLLVWQLERNRELALMRAVGVTRLGVTALMEAQTGFMGLAAVLAAAPVGVMSGVMLVKVINRRAFGWQIALHLHSSQFMNALVLALVAALVAGLYPAWRAAHAPIATRIREE
jgi:putative ABC transport system permease protein